MHLLRFPPFARPSRLAPVAFVLALATGACSSGVTDEAASVAGTTISHESVTGELDDIASNPTYLASVEQQFGPSAGEGEGTYNADFVARLLSLRTYYELIDQELERRGVEITTEDLDAARESAVQNAGGQESFDAFSESYQDQLVRQGALLGAIEASFNEEGAAAGDAEAYYEENQELFESRCLAHILVGTNDAPQPTGERTREEAAARAQELFAELAAGADFTAMASGPDNDDTASAANGGSLDCITRRSQLDPTFLEAAFAAEVGQVTEPVETQFGYHLILVSSAETPPFAEVKEEVDQVLAQQGAQLFDEFLRTESCTGDIEVSSRYGTWDTSQCGSGGIGMVTANPGPTTTTTTPDGPLAPGGSTPDAPGSGAGG